MTAITWASVSPPRRHVHEGGCQLHLVGSRREADRGATRNGALEVHARPAASKSLDSNACRCGDGSTQFLHDEELVQPVHDGRKAHRLAPDACWDGVNVTELWDTQLHSVVCGSLLEEDVALAVAVTRCQQVEPHLGEDHLEDWLCGVGDVQVVDDGHVIPESALTVNAVDGEVGADLLHVERTVVVVRRSVARHHHGTFVFTGIELVGSSCHAILVDPVDDYVDKGPVYH
ncbi:hypothetical protein MRX96_019204 [Rhipicephalus microplus]